MMQREQRSLRRVFSRDPAAVVFRFSLTASLSSFITCNSSVRASIFAAVSEANPAAHLNEVLRSLTDTGNYANAPVVFQI